MIDGELDDGEVGVETGDEVGVEAADESGVEVGDDGEVRRFKLFSSSALPGTAFNPDSMAALAASTSPCFSRTPASEI